MVKGKNPKNTGIKKPTALKLLEGNPGCRVIGPEVRPQPVADSCPGWLSASAKETWSHLANRLERLGLLTEVDGADFGNLCQAIGDVKDLTEIINDYGFTFETDKGYITQRPEVNLRNQAIKIVTTLAGKFGMSPSDRAGLVGTPQEDKSSKMGKLLSK